MKGYFYVSLNLVAVPLFEFSKLRDTPPLNSKIITEHADCECQERNSPYLGSDRVVIVLLGAALQCKFLPFLQDSLFHSSVVMYHLPFYQFLMFTDEFKRITPFVKHTRNLYRKNRKKKLLKNTSFL